MEHHPSAQTNVIIVGKSKSVGLAFLLAFLFGPLGLLYASILGGIFMMVAGLLLFFVLPVAGGIIAWIVCIVWSVIAANKANETARKQASSGFKNQPLYRS